MNTFKFTQQPKQRYPGDRKWENEDAPKDNNKKPKRHRQEEGFPE